MKSLFKHPNIVAAIVIVVVLGGLIWWRQTSHSPTPNASGESSTGFNKKQYSLDDPNSIWVIVNKKRPLPNNFAPGDLVVPNVALRLDASQSEMKVRQTTADALEALFAAAKAEAGYDLTLASGFRSQEAQTALYNYYSQAKGQTAADTDSARPGYSEHQTGLAVDIGRADQQCDVQACFADTPEGKWLAANAYTYGFIMRYLPGQQAVTGYVAEPWHFRYVGKELAAQLHENPQPLETFFGLPAAPDYN